MQWGHHWAFRYVLVLCITSRNHLWDWFNGKSNIFCQFKHMLEQSSVANMYSCRSRFNVLQRIRLTAVQWFVDMVSRSAYNEKKTSEIFWHCDCLFRLICNFIATTLGSSCTLCLSYNTVHRTAAAIPICMGSGVERMWLVIKALELYNHYSHIRRDIEEW